MEKVRACGASQVIWGVCLLAPTERYTFMELKKKNKKKRMKTCLDDCSRLKLF